MTLLRPIITCLSLMLFSPIAQTTSYQRDELIQLNQLMITKMIQTLGPNLSTKRSRELAKKIHQASFESSLDPKIFLAIIATESNFRNNVVSPTGDLSLAQINVPIWNKEFKRLGLPLLDKSQLKQDEVYALTEMGKILNILKERHQKYDENWYTTYHSKTKKLKDKYAQKIQRHLKSIASLSHQTLMLAGSEL